MGHGSDVSISPGKNKTGHGLSREPARVNSSEHQAVQLGLRRRAWLVVQHDTDRICIRDRHGRVQMGQYGVIVAAEHDVSVFSVDHRLTRRKLDFGYFDPVDLFESQSEMIDHSSKIRALISSICGVH